MSRAHRRRPASSDQRLRRPSSTANLSDTGGGTEVTGGPTPASRRPCRLSELAGTQAGVASTTAPERHQRHDVGRTTRSRSPADGQWGTVTGIGIFDATSAGNLFSGAADHQQDDQSTAMPRPGFCGVVIQTTTDPAMSLYPIGRRRRASPSSPALPAT